jgi:hypothetical protein
MKFFEETANMKFVDAKTGRLVIDILAKRKNEKKSDYDLWLEERDKETREAHEMEQI